MQRISTTTKVVDKFGAGKHGFTNGNVVGGIPATDLEDAWFDNVQEEIARVVEAAGIVLDGNDKAQLLAAIRIVAQGRLLNIQVLDASGTFIRTAGALSGLLLACGGGGGGAGSAATGAGQVSVGAGGGSGSWGLHFFSGNLPASQAYTIGGAGAGGVAGGAGGAGGSTIFGALTAPGATANSAVAAGTPPVLIGPSSVPVTATGFNVINARGNVGGYGLAVGAGGFVSGAGASSIFGGGAFPNVTGSAAGQAAGCKGSGGAGASAGASTGALNGGAGSAGRIVVFEFA